MASTVVVTVLMYYKRRLLSLSTRSGKAWRMQVEMSRKWMRRQKGRPRERRRKAKGGLGTRREIEVNTYNRSVVLRCGPQTSSITWELVRKANRLAHPRLLNQKLRNGALLTSPPGDSGAC